MQIQLLRNTSKIITHYQSVWRMHLAHGIFFVAEIMFVSKLSVLQLFF